jgi:hypothetical protein
MTPPEGAVRYLAIRDTEVWFEHVTDVSTVSREVLLLN